jgi:Zn-dependent protease with chaperone function
MSLPYLLRLLCLCLASFFLVHLALGLLISLASPWAVSAAGRMRPRAAAGFLLLLRLLPAGAALLAVAGLCAPSYVWLEPAATTEEVGIACLLAAALCLVSLFRAAARAGRALSRSLGYVRYCEFVGLPARLGSEYSPAWVIEGQTPFVVLAGIMHPRLLVSRGVVNGLSAEQLSAALRHEYAHQAARDNLKRLLVLLAPDAFPFWHGFDALERAWSRFAEWAADDRSVAGDSRRSVSLASALVRVARMGAMPQPAPLVTSLLGDSLDLAQRVNRLLRETPEAPTHGRPALTIAACAAACGCLLAAMLQPATLQTAHRVLEHLTR